MNWSEAWPPNAIQFFISSSGAAMAMLASPASSSRSTRCSLRPRHVRQPQKSARLRRACSRSRRSASCAPLRCAVASCYGDRRPRRQPHLAARARTRTGGGHGRECETITTPDGAFGAYVARPAARPGAGHRGDPGDLRRQRGDARHRRRLRRARATWRSVRTCSGASSPASTSPTSREAEWKRAFELFNAFDVDRRARTSPRPSPTPARIRLRRQGRRGRLLPWRPAGLPHRHPHRRRC